MTAVSRRAAIGAPAALMLSAGACGAQPTGPSGQTRALVAYFSRSGNTRVIAGQLHRELPADLFEIRPARPYPEDYEQIVAQASREREAGFRPELAGRVASLSAYDVVWLGFPVWGQSVPPPVRAFLAAHDLSGKTVRPFVTHGGYGLGDSLSMLRADAPRARFEAAVSMEADQERRTMNQVREWLAKARPRATNP
ncbi:flavodoxin [Caulobacter radicis]|uniref:flavodoxin n=1 Tax=Caulobacter radicis TaxID=2172650 RepID=UPI001AD81801|nr:flavodoxin [Caulobacter radicis]